MSVRFQIVHCGVVIAESSLDRLDPAMSIATGTFFPTEHYWSVLRNVAGSNVSKDDAEVIVLTDELEIRTATGSVVPTTWVRLEDLSSALGENGREVTVCAADSVTFEEYLRKV